MLKWKFVFEIVICLFFFENNVNVCVKCMDFWGSVLVGDLFDMIKYFLINIGGWWGRFCIDFILLIYLFLNIVKNILRLKSDYFYVVFIVLMFCF